MNEEHLKEKHFPKTYICGVLVDVGCDEEAAKYVVSNSITSPSNRFSGPFLS